VSLGSGSNASGRSCLDAKSPKISQQVFMLTRRRCLKSARIVLRREDVGALGQLSPV